MPPSGRGRRRRPVAACNQARYVILSPIRPSPTIPSCIVFLSLNVRAESASSTAAIRLAQACVDGSLEVNAHAATMALVERLPIAQRLCGEQRAEPTFMPGIIRSSGSSAVICRTTHASGTALVQLTGRVEEAWPEANGRRNAMCVANLQPQALSSSSVWSGFARDVRGDRDVIARFHLREDPASACAGVCAEMLVLPER